MKHRWNGTWEPVTLSLRNRKPLYPPSGCYDQTTFSFARPSEGWSLFFYFFFCRFIPLQNFWNIHYILGEWGSSEEWRSGWVFSTSLKKPEFCFYTLSISAPEIKLMSFFHYGCKKTLQKENIITVIRKPFPIFTNKFAYHKETIVCELIFLNSSLPFSLSHIWISKILYLKINRRVNFWQKFYPKFLYSFLSVTIWPVFCRFFFKFFYFSSGACRYMLIIAPCTSMHIPIRTSNWIIAKVFCVPWVLNAVHKSFGRRMHNQQQQRSKIFQCVSLFIYGSGLPINSHQLIDRYLYSRFMFSSNIWMNFLYKKNKPAFQIRI